MRRNEPSSINDPLGEKIIVPVHYWMDLKTRDPNKLCRQLLIVEFPPNGFILSVLGREILVDRNEMCLKSRRDESWRKIDYPLLELLVLVYFLKGGAEAVKNEMIGVQELKDSRFFQGPHEFRLDPLLVRYGSNPNISSVSCTFWALPIFSSIPRGFALVFRTSSVCGKTSSETKNTFAFFFSFGLRE